MCRDRFDIVIGDFNQSDWYLGETVKYVVVFFDCDNPGIIVRWSIPGELTYIRIVFFILPVYEG